LLKLRLLEKVEDFLGVDRKIVLKEGCSQCLEEVWVVGVYITNTYGAGKSGNTNTICWLWIKQLFF